MKRAFAELVNLMCRFEQGLYRDPVQLGTISVTIKTVQLDRVMTVERFELFIRIILIGNAAGHAVAEALAESAKVHDGPVGHIFTAEVTNAFDNGGRAGVPNPEAVACATFHEQGRARRTEESEVADQIVFPARRHPGEWMAMLPPDAPLPDAVVAGFRRGGNTMPELQKAA